MTTYQYLLISPPPRPGNPSHPPTLLEFAADTQADALLLAKKIRSTFPGFVGLRAKPKLQPFVPVDLDVNIPPEDPRLFADYLASFKVNVAFADQAAIEHAGAQPL